MLDGAADADRDIEFGRDDLARLADLQFVRHVAGIDRCARCADGSAELVGEVVDDLEILRRAHAAAAGDDALGALQVGTLGGTGGEADETRMGRQLDIDVERFNTSVATASRFWP